MCESLRKYVPLTHLVFAQAVWRRLVDTWTMSMDGASLRGATLAITVHESDVASVDYTDVVPWTRKPNDARRKRRK